MAGLLAEFLRASCAVPFAWGRTDCLWWALAWADRLSGGDSVARLQPRYGRASALGVYRMVRAAGGWSRFLDDLAPQAGLVPVGEPEPGDIILTVVPGRRFVDGRCFMGLWVGPGRAALRGPGGGVAVARCVPERAWRVARAHSV